MNLQSNEHHLIEKLGTLTKSLENVSPADQSSDGSQASWRSIMRNWTDDEI